MLWRRPLIQKHELHSTFINCILFFVNCILLIVNCVLLFVNCGDCPYKLFAEETLVPWGVKCIKKHSCNGRMILLDAEMPRVSSAECKSCVDWVVHWHAHSFYRCVHLMKKGGTAEVVKCLNILSAIVAKLNMSITNQTRNLDFRFKHIR